MFGHCLLLLPCLCLSSGAGMPLLDPESMPLPLDPEDIPLLDPEDMPFLDPEAMPLLDPADLPLPELDDMPLRNPEDMLLLDPEELLLLYPDDLPPAGPSGPGLFGLPWLLELGGAFPPKSSFLAGLSLSLLLA